MNSQNPTVSELKAAIINVEGYAGLLSEILGRVNPTEADFISLAITGETLRRVDKLNDVLVLYDAALRSWVDLAPDYTADALYKALSEIEKFVALQPHKRRQDGAELVNELDEIFNVLFATVRAGRLTVDEGMRLASETRQRLGTIRFKAVPLWQPAEYRNVFLGPDPDFPEAYAWQADLGRFSMTRLSER